MKFHLIARSDLAEESPLFLELEDYKEYLRKHADLVSRADRADAILVLGGDGSMFHAIRRHHQRGLPFFGVNFGHVGFLMTARKKKFLKDIIAERVHFIETRMLQADLYDVNGEFLRREVAFNDFYFERSTSAIANMSIAIKGKVRFELLRCDGVIVATSAGSTAYNGAVGGIILPIESRDIALSAIAPALSQGWHNAHFSEGSSITLKAERSGKHPVRFLADGKHIRDVVRAEISHSDIMIRIGFANAYDFIENRLLVQLQR